jgi:hypothetical protein
MKTVYWVYLPISIGVAAFSWWSDSLWGCLAAGFSVGWVAAFGATIPLIDKMEWKK